MHTRAVIALALLCMVGSVVGAHLATCRLFPTNVPNFGTGTGLVYFDQETDDTFTITISITGLLANTVHGMHIHLWGDTTAPDGTAALTHFNPDNQPHACWPNPLRHVGDLGNFTTDGTGAYSGVWTRDLLTVNFTGTTATQRSIIGRGLIVHQNPDDCVTPGTGNAGARLMQGTIGIAEFAPTWVRTGFLPNYVTNGEHVMGSIYNNAGANIGTVRIRDNGGTIQLYLIASGFAPGSVHGIHIHAFGDHTNLNGANAQGHFNPLGQAHALTDEWGTTRHLGDLGNVVAASDGTIYLYRAYDLLVLGGDSLSNVVGHGFIIHSKNDEGSLQQPTGNSGTRVGVAVLGLGVSTFPTPSTAPYAVAVARVWGTAARPGVTGTVTLSMDAANTVNAVFDLAGLPASTALSTHIHEFGDLTDYNGAANTFGHFNPHKALHGCPPNGTRHAGDIGTFTTSATGTYTGTISVNGLMAFSGQNSTIGRAIIIHSQFDNCGQPTGNAGSRIAQGVIGIENPSPLTTTNTAVNPSDYAVSRWSVLNAVINPTTSGGNLRGFAWFTPSPIDPTKTLVYVNVTGTTPGLHGVHIHTYGDLTAQDGTETGAHWNPLSVDHGFPENATHHRGDLGNLWADANGNGFIYGTFNLLDFSGIVGRAIIVHSAEDLGPTYQPAGRPTDSPGTRIGYGVIGISSLTVPTPVWESSTGVCIGDDCSAAAGVRASFVVVLLAALLALVIRF